MSLSTKNKRVKSDSQALLKPIAFAFFFLYLLLSLSHFFLLSEDFKWTLIALSSLTMIVSFVLMRKAGNISADRQSFWILILLAFGTINSVLHLWLSQLPEQTTNIFLVIIASGIVFSNRAHWAFLIVLNWLGWIVVNLAVDMPMMMHFFFALFMGTMLSWFAHLARRTLVSKQAELLQERDIAVAHEQEAIAANEAKSAFLANMSHEIRTPMNGIIGMIEIISRTNLNDDQKQFIATAKRSADSLLFVINDILDFSKIEAGELRLENVEFEITQFMRDLVQEQKVLADSKGLKLDLVTNNSKQLNVVGDPYRMKQVFNNLLSNAVKFTDRGGVTIKYDVVSIDDTLRFSTEIHDTGIGICGSAIPSLFDSFSQADTSTTRKFGGTGLGLAITKQLCELMGGDIAIESTLGKGSIFKFTIPLKPAEQTEPGDSDEHPEALQPLMNLSVLLVEDNDINQEVMLAILENMGVNVGVANDGLEAIDILEASDSTHYDLIFMDCQMPNLDGYETTRRIRAGHTGEALRQIPIVALTANAMDSEKQKCFDAGMNDYLTKPIDIESLKNTLALYQRN